MERFHPPGVNVTESPLYRIGQEQDGCVGNTIASICSQLTGQAVELHPIYYFQRGAMIEDEKRLYMRHRRRDRTTGKTHDDPIAAFIRLDQRVFRKVLTQVQENRWAVGSAPALEAIIDSVNITYNRGSYEDIVNSIIQGNQVAACFKLPESGVEKPDRTFHIAHLGFAENDTIVRLSDNGELVDEEIIEAINESATYLRDGVRTWNYVSVYSPYANIR